QPGHHPERQCRLLDGRRRRPCRIPYQQPHRPRRSQFDDVALLHVAAAVLRMFTMRFTLPLLALCAALSATPAAHAERLKDMASIAGVRQNQLSGYGLVVGLDGTGDQTSQTPFTVQ